MQFSSATNIHPNIRATNPSIFSFLKPLEDLPITYRQFNFFFSFSCFCFFNIKNQSKKILLTSEIVFFSFSLLSSRMHVRQYLIGFSTSFPSYYRFISFFDVKQQREELKTKENYRTEKGGSLYFILNYYIYPLIMYNKIKANKKKLNMKKL